MDNASTQSVMLASLRWPNTGALFIFPLHCRHNHSESASSPQPDLLMQPKPASNQSNYMSNMNVCTHCFRTRLCTRLGLWKRAFKWISHLMQNVSYCFWSSVVAVACIMYIQYQDIIFTVLVKHFQCNLNCTIRGTLSTLLLPQLADCLILSLFSLTLSFFACTQIIILC